MTITEKLLAVYANTERVDALNKELEQTLKGKSIVPAYTVTINDTSDSAVWEEEVVSYSIDGGNTFIPIKNAQTTIPNVSTIEFRASSDYGGSLTVKGDVIWGVVTYEECKLTLTEDTTFELYVSW